MLVSGVQHNSLFMQKKIFFLRFVRSTIILLPLDPVLFITRPWLLDFIPRSLCLKLFCGAVVSAALHSLGSVYTWQMEVFLLTS